MYWFFLFVFGLVIGSFWNVVAARYDGDHWLFDPHVIGGRSHCPHCRHKLEWFELFPVFSFIFLGGRCRKCKAKIGWQYPVVELLSALIFTLIPWRLAYFYGTHGWGFIILSALWIIAFETLLLISYVDIRLQIIPDEITVGFCGTAIAAAIASVLFFGTSNQSFLGIFGGLFGLQNNFWIAHIVGAVAGAAFFEILVLVTRGRGMGMGDVKLALPLGFLFGWPDILFLYAAAFVVGAIVGIAFVARGKKSMKAALPFAPFLMAGATFVLFFGMPFVEWYLHLIGF